LINLKNRYEKKPVHTHEHHPLLTGREAKACEWEKYTGGLAAGFFMPEPNLINYFAG